MAGRIPLVDHTEPHRTRQPSPHLCHSTTPLSHAQETCCRGVLSGICTYLKNKINTELKPFFQIREQALELQAHHLRSPSDR